MRTPLSLLIGALFLITPSAQALQIGDVAPAFSVHWVKGDPVSFGDNAHFYVIELWATWCAPCRDNFPRMTALQERYREKGVIVIGLSDEPESTVESFVKRHERAMGYRVATDQSGATTDLFSRGTPTYFGIPFSLIVDQRGEVVWFGMETAQIAPTLDALLSGTYDPTSLKESHKDATLYQQYFSLLKTGEDAKPTGEALLETKDAALLLRFASSILRLELELVFRPSAIRFERDLLLAKRAAARACELTPDNPDAFQSYAKVLYELGDLGGAILKQEEALRLCQDKKIRRQYKSTLRFYRREQRRAERS